MSTLIKYDRNDGDAPMTVGYCKDSSDHVVTKLIEKYRIKNYVYQANDVKFSICPLAFDKYKPGLVIIDVTPEELEKRGIAGLADLKGLLELNNDIEILASRSVSLDVPSEISKTIVDVLDTYKILGANPSDIKTKEGTACADWLLRLYKAIKNKPLVPVD